MRIQVKILKGAECTVNVADQDKVLRLKEIVAEKLDVPVNCQRIVHRGKPLSDEWTMKQCAIKDGTKLFLAVKKSDDGAGQGAPGADGAGARAGLDLWDELHYLTLKHYRQSDAKLIMEEFRKIFTQSVHSLSLDDIERLATVELQKS